jgi:hypothetical protein
MKKQSQNKPNQTQPVVSLPALSLPLFLLDFGFGKNFSIFFHCSFVNFHRSLAIFKTPFDDQVYITRLMAQV